MYKKPALFTVLIKCLCVSLENECFKVYFVQISCAEISIKCVDEGEF